MAEKEIKPEEITRFIEAPEEEVEEKLISAGAEEKVNPLDPDFILMFFFAGLVDSSDIILELFGITKPFGIGFDIVTFVIICGWMKWRMGRIAERKKARQAAIRKGVQQSMAKLEKLGKRAEEFAKLEEKAAQQLGKMDKMLRGLGKSPLFRSALRGTITLLGEILWLVGLIPFWMISVILMLREK